VCTSSEEAEGALLVEHDSPHLRQTQFDLGTDSSDRPKLRRTAMMK